MAMSNSLPKLQAEGNMLRSSKAEEDVEDESYPFVEGVNDSTRSMSARYLEPQRTNMWMVTTFVLTFLLLASGIRDYIHSRQSVSKDYGYDTGFDTEWPSARESIRLKKVKFYGGIKFDDNEKQYTTKSPDEPMYVGPPSQELDDAWHALIHNESIAVTPEEAKEISDRSAYDKYRGHYTVGLSVLHSLHCLNAIRISQDVEHYRAQGFPEEWWARFHIDHCINHLRQMIQCHGDVTPTPLVPASRDPAKKGWITPDFDVEHTCRDFSAIRQWATEKHEEGMRLAKAAAHKGT